MKKCIRLAIAAVVLLLAVALLAGGDVAWTIAVGWIAFLRPRSPA